MRVTTSSGALCLRIRKVFVSNPWRSPALLTEVFSVSLHSIPSDVGGTASLRNRLSHA